LTQEIDDQDLDISLQVAQKNDKDIQTIIKWLKHGKSDSIYIGCESYYLKSLWAQRQRLSIHEGLLVRKWEVAGTNINN
jgi:hypothetical protein